MEEITTENINLVENPKEKVLYKIRCPDCITLYEVEANKIISTSPEFECPQCHCLFGFDYPPLKPHSILTFKIPETQFVFKKHCPKCNYLQDDKNKI